MKCDKEVGRSTFCENEADYVVVTRFRNSTYKYHYFCKLHEEQKYRGCRNYITLEIYERFALTSQEVKEWFWELIKPSRGFTEISTGR